MGERRVKKIRYLLRAQQLPNADTYNEAYKQMKSTGHPTNKGPDLFPATKRHKGESLMEFKRRRAKVNEAKRLRKKTGIKWTRPES